MIGIAATGRNARRPKNQPDSRNHTKPREMNPLIRVISCDFVDRHALDRFSLSFSNPPGLNQTPPLAVSALLRRGLTQYLL